MTENEFVQVLILIMGRGWKPITKGRPAPAKSVSTVRRRTSSIRDRVIVVVYGQYTPAELRYHLPTVVVSTSKQANGPRTGGASHHRLT